MYNNKLLSPSPHSTYPTPDISAPVIHVKYSFITFCKMSHIIEQINQQLQREPQGSKPSCRSLSPNGSLQGGHFVHSLWRRPWSGEVCPISTCHPLKVYLLIPNSCKHYIGVPKTLPLGDATHSKLVTCHRATATARQLCLLLGQDRVWRVPVCASRPHWSCCSCSQ